MQWVDILVGPLPCFLLTIARPLLIRRANPDRRLRQIAFLKLSEQGSTVLAIPAIQDAIRRVERENVYFVVFEQNRAILHVLRILPEENILLISNRDLRSFIKSVGEVVGFLRRQKIDSCIDLDFFTRATAILACLSGGL